jgi:hypothetical protein
MNLLLSTHRDSHTLHGWVALRPVVSSLPYVGRELGCGLPIIYSSERISGCMRESTDDVSFRSESEIYNLCPGPVFSSGESSPRHVRPIAHKRLLQGRTPLFLSRLLTRVPIQSFERWVGGRALGGSRNFEISPIQSTSTATIPMPLGL